MRRLVALWMAALAATSTGRAWAGDVTREAAEQLGLAPGQEATAVVKATSVLIDS